MRAWTLRLAGLFTARRRARAFEAELQSHLEMEIAELIETRRPCCG